jgi:hypothetical protein
MKAPARRVNGRKLPKEEKEREREGEREREREREKTQAGER